MSNKYYAGLDLATKTSRVCVVDDSGKVIKEATLHMTENYLEEFFQKLPCERCIIEAAPLAEHIVKRLSTVSNCEFIIVDPRDAKKAVKRGKKTDKIDAQGLAQLCRTGWYVTVHRKSEAARLMRSHLTARAQLQKTVTAVKSSIRGIFRAHGIQIPAGQERDFYADVVKELAQHSALKAVIKPLIAVLESTEEQLLVSSKYLKKVAPKDETCELLMSHPGVGPFVSLAYAATIDDPKRFNTGEKVAAYLGLTPSIYQSGDTEYRGRITKDGDANLRWLLVEAAHVILYRCKKDYPIRKWGLMLAEKKGYAKAKVAVARKLAVTLHKMWLTNTEYNFIEAKEIAA
jgi:transposase